MKQRFKIFFICLVILTGIIFSFIPAVQAANEPLSLSWFPGGPGVSINAITSDTNFIYYGGSFSGLYKKTGNGAKVTTYSSENNTAFPFVNGSIEAVSPDGNGGWYIGGIFDKVGDSLRNGLAQINSDGSISGWNPNVSGGTVNTIVVSGNYVYTGGTFTSIGGITRNYIAKLNNTTGAPDNSWNPDASGSVSTIFISGDSIYAGGSFNTIGGLSRRGIAKLNNTTGAAYTWNANLSSGGLIFTIAVSGNVLYVGGVYNSIGGQTRGNIAKLNKATALLDLNWSADTDAQVYSIVLNGTSIYICGNFTSVKGTGRNRAAKLNNLTGAVDANWNPNLSLGVLDMAVTDSAVYIAGGFTTAGSTSRNFIAKLNTTTGAAITDWNVSANSIANKIRVSGNDIYIGGTFSGVNPVLRNYITRFNKTTGVPDTLWNPNPNNSVSTIAITGNEIYIGGTFTALGSTTRNRIAKVDNTSGQPYPEWNANASAQVNIITISGTEIYAGGAFTTIGGSTRNRIAKLNSSTGNAEPWNPNAGNTVQTIAISGNSVYAGGDFTSIGGLTRNRIAKLNNITGLADSTWNPNASAAVNAITVNGDDIYAGGSFTTIGGISKNRLAKLNNTTGAAEAAWNPNPSAFINKIVISGEDMYVIGNFSTIGGFSITRLAKLKAATGIVNSSWTVTGSQGFLPNFLFAEGSTIYLGGNFTGKINGVISPNIAIFKNEEQTGAGNTVISGSGFTSFNTTTDTTAVSISIDAGAGTGQVNVYKYNDSASNISGTPIYVSGYRWIVQQKGLATPFTGKIKFKLSEIPNEPLGNPENIVVYSRPTPGSGSFSALPTTYDQAAGEITAAVTSFSEFIFGSDDLLPVELASFTSSVNGNNMKLQWSTISEVNNSGFDIERKSVTGNEWKKIGNVTGAGNSNEVKNYSYTESGLAAGKYNYRLKQIDYNGNFEYHSLANEVIIGMPSKFMLSQNYPNPFNPVTRISYELPVTNYVSLKVYDIQGKEVMTLVNEVKDAGYYSVTFDAGNLSSGVYFYKLVTSSFIATKRMVLLK